MQSKQTVRIRVVPRKQALSSLTRKKGLLLCGGTVCMRLLLRGNFNSAAVARQLLNGSKKEEAMAAPYNHREIEEKWRKEWETNPVNVNDGKKPKYYCLDMFPYPSGNGLHVGHWRGYVISDVWSSIKCSTAALHYSSHGMGCVRPSGRKLCY